jgi:hypothetical protein
MTFDAPVRDRPHHRKRDDQGTGDPPLRMVWGSAIWMQEDIEDASKSMVFSQSWWSGFE